MTTNRCDVSSHPYSLPAPGAAMIPLPTRARPFPFLMLAAGLLAAGNAAAQPMSGLYTINPVAGATPPNFITFAAAVSALTTNGVGGPVVFDVYDDGGPYTETNPFISVNVAWAPNTAVLSMALWTGVSATNTVTFRAAAGELPVIDATGKAMGVYWGKANYTRLEGLEIMNAMFDGINMYQENVATNPGGILVSAVVQGCRIHHCNSAGISVYGNGTNTQDVVIRNNFFWHLQTANSGGFATNARFGYVCTRRDVGTIIEHNTFYVDTGTGSEFAVMGSLRGAPSTPWASLRNNLIVKLAGPTRPVYSFRDAGSIPTLMDYNIYDDTSGGTFLNDAGILTATLGAFQAGPAYAPREAASRTGFANLIGPATGDLHIQPGSAAAGAATTIAAVTNDIDGETRPLGCARDIGADEFAEPSPVASFTATPLTGPPPLLVQFTDTSTSCAGGITNWSWDFTGGGINLSNLQNPTFTYTCPGSYSVTLNVTDPSGVSQVVATNFITVLPWQFQMTTTAGQGNLTITPVPSTCPQTAGAVKGWTIISFTTTPGSVGQGFFFGLNLDTFAFLSLSTPPTPGYPLSFFITGTLYPDAGPLILPPGFFSGLIGATMDAVMVFTGPLDQLIYWSNAAQVTF